jgi:hypothetical protein
MQWQRAPGDGAAAGAVADIAGGGEEWTQDAALVEVLRALSGFGPQTVAAIAGPLALSASSVAIALAQLESEGYVMRGRFTPGTTTEEWCERHLLARIHRYTIKACAARSSRSSGRTSCASCSSGSIWRLTRSCKASTRCLKCWRSWRLRSRRRRLGKRTIGAAPARLLPVAG